MSPIVYYFGCIRDKGHHMWDPVSKRVMYRFDRDLNTPWGDSIDGGVFPTGPITHKAGVIQHKIQDGWSIICFADYSIDDRPGSHSSFLVHTEASADQLVIWAKNQWPEVFLREGSPPLRIPVSPTSTPASHASSIPPNPVS